MNQIYESPLWNMSFCPERADFNPKLGVMEEANKLWELLCSFFFFFFKQGFIMAPAAAAGSNKQVPLLAPRGRVQAGSLNGVRVEVCPGVTGGVA